MEKTNLHFKDKTTLEHLIEARRKGQMAMETNHGTELPGHLFAAVDAIKETALVLLLLSLLSNDWMTQLFFLLGWCIWKTARSAFLGYARLERLHRLIEEERWEIEHHRNVEKEELREMYHAKGFRGKLLDEAVDVLMADDNRLLRVMLEEELGVNLEQLEHPLKQAAGALLGSLIAGALCLAGLSFFSLRGICLASALCIAGAAGLAAKRERNKPIPSAVWNLAAVALAAGLIYFL